MGSNYIYSIYTLEASEFTLQDLHHYTEEMIKLDFVFLLSLFSSLFSPPPYIMPEAFESTCSGKVII